jgi:hypothetical protein
MKRYCVLAAFFIAYIASSAASMEIESIMGLGNVAFDSHDESSLEAAEGDFEPLLHAFGSVVVSDRLNEILDFRAGFDRDPILRNTIFTQVGFTSDYARLTFGPFFGPFNAEGSVMSTGLSASLRLELPGLAFATFRADSTIGAGLSSPGDNVQERSEIAVGFWAPNSVVSFRISSQTFTLREERTLDIADERTRYELLADIYKKNVPYTAGVNIGYQALTRSYIGQLDTAEDELRSAIVGFELSVQATDNLKLMIGSEAALYSWGANDLGSPSADTALFTLRFGVTIVLPNTGFAARNAALEGQ